MTFVILTFSAVIGMALSLFSVLFVISAYLILRDGADSPNQPNRK